MPDNSDKGKGGPLLRCYFFLRRQLGPGYLDLLRFFLNHRAFSRSERPERVGKSPTELMTGRSHPHWLELLGFERFRRSPVPAFYEPTVVNPLGNLYFILSAGYLFILDRVSPGLSP